MIRPLAAHPNIEIRIYNPFVARRQLAFLRGAEYLLEAGRLNYRMHNKLFVADNAIAITGGRNVGDEYFQAGNDVAFGDIDLAVAGPTVRQLSGSFDLYWNDRLAVPVETLPLGKPSAADLETCRAALAAHGAKMAHVGLRSLAPRARSARRHAVGAGGRWYGPRREFAYDLPDKAQADSRRRSRARRCGARCGARRRRRATEELIIVSPYLVPGDSEMELLRRLRQRDVRVRILTNSLASTDMPIAHAGYIRHRIPLLELGVELYEVRTRLGQPEASGGPIKPGAPASSRCMRRSSSSIAGGCSSAR